jgi:Xaa-Pro aminopeptidase
LLYFDLDGIRIEDTILVTKDSYEMFALCHKRLEV